MLITLTYPNGKKFRISTDKILKTIETSHMEHYYQGNRVVNERVSGSLIVIPIRSIFVKESPEEIEQLKRVSALQLSLFDQEVL